MHFRVFSLGQGTESGIFFGVAKISNNDLGCLKFLGPSLRIQKKMRVPPGVSSQTYNEMCQLHITSAVSKTLAFR